ncbi:MAG: hypothetical protein DME09_19955 [Candidatus Rokuibacteriota bacterium]|nr:MAG: hypothetical protein DME09_19955 [Candidatus Rokubacteria bacterium]
MVFTLVLAGGLVWVGRQYRTVPYVVDVDSLGAAPRDQARRPRRASGRRADRPLPAGRFHPAGPA